MKTLDVRKLDEVANQWFSLHVSDLSGRGMKEVSKEARAFIIDLKR